MKPLILQKNIIQSQNTNGKIKNNSSRILEGSPKLTRNASGISEAFVDNP